MVPFVIPWNDGGGSYFGSVDHTRTYGIALNGVHMESVYKVWTQVINYVQKAIIYVLCYLMQFLHSQIKFSISKRKKYKDEGYLWGKTYNEFCDCFNSQHTGAHTSTCTIRCWLLSTFDPGVLFKLEIFWSMVAGRKAKRKIGNHQSPQGFVTDSFWV